MAGYCTTSNSHLTMSGMSGMPLTINLFDEKRAERERESREQNNPYPIQFLLILLSRRQNWHSISRLI